MSQTGRLGTNPLPSTAPFPVPDSESHWVSSGGEGSHQPRTAGGTTRTSAVGACVLSSSRENSTPPSVPFYVSSNVPSVPFYVSSNVSLSHRSDQGMSLSLESHDSARIGSQSSPSLSLGSDQLRVSEGGSLGASSALSPTSLLFPVPDSGFSLSAPPSSSSSFTPSSLFSVATASSSSLSSSSQFSIPPVSIPLPSFAPSFLSSASFPSSLLSSSLPPSIPSVLSSSLLISLPPLLCRLLFRFLFLRLLLLSLLLLLLLLVSLISRLLLLLPCLILLLPLGLLLPLLLRLAPLSLHLFLLLRRIARVFWGYPPTISRCSLVCTFGWGCF